MSKMGISTYQSYCGAQIFEAVGLQKAFVDKYFTGTASNVEGIGLFEVAEEAARLHALAFGDDPLLRDALDAGGEYQYRVRGEEHMWTPDSIAKLQHAARANSSCDVPGVREADQRAEPRAEDAARPVRVHAPPSARRCRSTRSSRRSDDRQALRDRRDEPRLDLDRGAHDARDRDEPHRRQVEHRRRRRGRGALSRRDARGQEHGRGRRHAGERASAATASSTTSRSRPATACARRSSRSRRRASASPPSTWRPPTSCRSRWRRARSPAKAASCPATRSPSTSRKLRYSVPGVGLISPPPHHDIYSIEDLAQLIHDLKNANPQASISVKLVSEVGVGTVAAGVAKAKADHVTIAGHDGGTGASPVSSIKHAGTPWELGLAETQQTLVLNRLRGRIAVQVDGQMKTGRDVVDRRAARRRRVRLRDGAAGRRRLHHDAQVPSQHLPGRRRDAGSGAAHASSPASPSTSSTIFFFVAEEVREIMAKLGFRRFDEMIGRADLLDMRAGIEHWKAHGPRLLARVLPAADAAGGRALPLRGAGPRPRARARPPADRRGRARARQAASRCGSTHKIRNAHRSVGAMLSGAVARTLRPRGPARGHDPRRVRGHRRPELRRVPRARHHVRAAGRDQRLRRQGPVGRAHRRLSRPDVSRRSPRRTSSSATR